MLHELMFKVNFEYLFDLYINYYCPSGDEIKKITWILDELNTFLFICRLFEKGMLPNLQRSFEVRGWSKILFVEYRPSMWGTNFANLQLDMKWRIFCSVCVLLDPPMKCIYTMLEW